MRKLFLGIIVSVFLSGLVTAQNIRLNAFSEYVFDDNIDTYYNPTSYFEGTIKGGFQWGVGGEYLVDKSKGVELKYLRRSANGAVDYYDNTLKHLDFNIGMNYILLGANNYFKVGEKLEPYAGAAFGMAIINFKDSNSSSESSKTKFAWSVKLGTNIWINEKIGIKLQADLLSAVQSVGGTLYFGTSGSGAGVSTYSTMYQWGLGGGLTFNLGEK
jgi:hypothetical protein